jgi:thiamine kinase-like enzyme
MNLLETAEGIKIIDWVDASSGSIGADVCRTYLLYKMNTHEMADIIAETYLELYCERSKIERQEINLWIPIIAAARLSENGIREEEIERLKQMI